MQIRVFTVPAIGGEAVNEEMNVFLRSRKILQVREQLVSNEQGIFWSFCVKYLNQHDTSPGNNSGQKPDYSEILEPAAFERFKELRKIRLKIAKDEGVPAYAVFTDEELANLSKIELLTAANMKSVKGIGDKKADKYGPVFLAALPTEKQEQPLKTPKDEKS
ncbi:MAG: HRDC domain-containing protein [Sphingobacteriales bacterium]|nr:MAG: HRDC domain-containing protein [Sphingobacteriales bacterium]